MRDDRSEALRWTAGGGGATGANAAARRSAVGCRYTSLIDTDGRSSRFRARAQNRAITIESAPRSSKKCASTDTFSTSSTPASTSANASATGAGGAAAAGGDDR